MQQSKFHRTGAFKISPNIIGILFIVFILFDLLLLYYLFNPDQRSVSPVYEKKFSSHLVLPNLYLEILHKHFTLVSNEWRLLPKYSTVSTNELNCSSLSGIKKMDFVATGWTKASYRISIANKVMMLKVVNINGHDVSSCIAHGQSLLWNCYMNAASKILKEIINLKLVSHENVIKILGYCIPEKPTIDDNRYTTSVITEFGETLDVIRLLQMSWEDRLRISLGLAKLLRHLSVSLLDSVSLNDFRRQQFVLVEGELKLVDVDDIGIGDPLCVKSTCCMPSDVSEKQVCVPCINNVCKDYNEKRNIISAGKHFINYILPHGVPPKLAALVNEIIYAYNTAVWNSAQILKETKHLCKLFIEGLYRNETVSSYISGYTSKQNKDLSTLYDYRCKLTVSGYGCSLSVFDAEEAAAICSSDIECKAFVLTNITTWTGRKIVHFKNGVGRYLPNNNTILYIKS